MNTIRRSFIAALTLASLALTSHATPAPVKPPVRWAVGEEPRQGDYECDAAAIVGWLRCAPQSRRVDYGKFIKDCFSIRRAFLEPTLDAAKDKGYIKGYRRLDNNLASLKAALLTGPVIVTMDFHPSFYAWQSGPLYVNGARDGHHSWLFYELNHKQKCFGAQSWWGNHAKYRFPFVTMDLMLHRDSTGIYQPRL